MLPTIEKGDHIISRDGQKLRVLSIFRNGDQILKVEGVNDNAPSPMRSTVFPKDIIKLLKKEQLAPVLPETPGPKTYTKDKSKGKN